MKYIAIIPARYASTRFPGKPLALIGGKPMIQRVYEQAKSVLDEVYVATDDQRIYDCVEQFGGRVIMTRSDHRCGTDRCLEAIEALGIDDKEHTVVINIQGDEPFIQPEQIRAIQSCFEGERTVATDIATLVQPYTEANTLEELQNPNSPKVVWNQETGDAILFSRSVIPYLRGIPQDEWLKQHKHYRHIGMYAYRADVLSEITQLPQSPLELAESLEQLRWLENGYHIRVATCRTSSIGIDTPEDLIKANEYLNHLSKA